MKRKIAALITSIVFFATSMNWNVPLSFAEPVAVLPSLPQPSLIQIPRELGSVESVYVGNPNLPKIILVQDAHAVISAQQKIKNLILYFRQKYGVEKVAVEGAEGAFDSVLLRAFPNEIVKRKVMEEYLNRGELSGAGLAAIMNPEASRFAGLENWQFYEENYLAYARAYQQISKIEPVYETLTGRMDARRAKVFSPELNRLHESARNFWNEKTDLPFFFKSLLEVKEGRDLLATGKYPKISAFALLMASEEKEDGQSLELSVREMAVSFKEQKLKNLPKAEEIEFNKHFHAFQTGAMDSKTFLTFLVEFGGRLGFKPRLTASMKAVLGDVQVLSAIKGTQLFKELEAYLDELNHLLANSPEAKELVDEYKKARLLKDLYKLELTREKLAIYQKSPEDYLALSGEKKDLFTPALDFYRLALKRDEIFHQNLSRIYQKKNEPLLVVAGGFHTEGFEANLRKEGISYAVVMPKIESLAGHEHYAGLMMGDLSYKSHLKTTFYDAFARDVTVKLVEGLSASNFKKSIKVWRDEVIRLLAKEGRVADASLYTDYIDMLFKIYYEKFGDQEPGLSREELLKAIDAGLQDFQYQKKNQVWEKLQNQIRFLNQGVQLLAEKKQLSLESVKELLKPSEETAVSGVVPVSNAVFSRDYAPRSEMRSLIETQVPPPGIGMALPLGADIEGTFDTSGTTAPVSVAKVPELFTADELLAEIESSWIKKVFEKHLRGENFRREKPLNTFLNIEIIPGMPVILDFQNAVVGGSAKSLGTFTIIVDGDQITSLRTGGIKIGGSSEDRQQFHKELLRIILKLLKRKGFLSVAFEQGFRDGTPSQWIPNFARELLRPRNLSEDEIENKITAFAIDYTNRHPKSSREKPGLIFPLAEVDLNTPFVLTVMRSEQRNEVLLGVIADDEANRFVDASLLKVFRKAEELKLGFEMYGGAARKFVYQVLFARDKSVDTWTMRFINGLSVSDIDGWLFDPVNPEKSIPSQFKMQLYYAAGEKYHDMTPEVFTTFREKGVDYSMNTLRILKTDKGYQVFGASGTFEDMKAKKMRLIFPENFDPETLREKRGSIELHLSRLLPFYALYGMLGNFKVEDAATLDFLAKLVSFWRALPNEEGRKSLLAAMVLSSIFKRLPDIGEIEDFMRDVMKASDFYEAGMKRVRSEVRTNDSPEFPEWSQISPISESTLFKPPTAYLREAVALDAVASAMIRSYLQHALKWKHVDSIIISAVGEGAHFRVYEVIRKVHGKLERHQDVFKINIPRTHAEVEDGGPDLEHLAEFIKNDIGPEWAVDTEIITSKIPENDRTPGHVLIRQRRGKPAIDSFEEALNENPPNVKEVMSVFHHLLQLYDGLLTQKRIFVVDATLENALVVRARDASTESPVVGPAVKPKRVKRTKLSDFERAIKLSPDGEYQKDLDKGVPGDKVRRITQKPGNILNFFRVLWPVLIYWKDKDPAKRQISDLMIKKLKGWAEDKEHPLLLAGFLHRLVDPENDGEHTLDVLKEYFTSREIDTAHRVRKAWYADPKAKTGLSSRVRMMIVKELLALLRHQKEPVKEELPKELPVSPANQIAMEALKSISQAMKDWAASKKISPELFRNFQPIDEALAALQRNKPNRAIEGLSQYVSDMDHVVDEENIRFPPGDDYVQAIGSVLERLRTSVRRSEVRLAVEAEELLLWAREDDTFKILRENLDRLASEQRDQSDVWLGGVLEALSDYLKTKPSKDVLIGDDAQKWIDGKTGLAEDPVLKNEILQSLRFVTARALVKGEPMATAILDEELKFGGLSADALVLLDNPGILSQLLNMKDAGQFEQSETLLIYTGFLDIQKTGVESQDIQTFFEQGIANGERFALAYDSEMPGETKLAHQLVKNFREVMAFAYSAAKPLTPTKVQIAGRRGAVFGLLKDKTQGFASLEGMNAELLYASEGPVDSGVRALGWKRFMNLAELLLWKSQDIKGKNARHILDQATLNEAIRFINSLAQEAISRELISRAA